MVHLVACVNFFNKVVAKLNRHVGLSFEQTYLYRLSKADGWSQTEANNANVQWELLTPERVGELRDIGWFDVKEGLERLERGDRCYTVSIDGRLIHYSWVQRSGDHPITDAGVSVPVENGDLWIYHCRTADWARGRKIYPATLQRIVSDCFADGDSTAWIYTTRDNVASQRGIARAGFGLVATLDALRLGRHYLYFGRRNESASATPEIAPQHS